MIVGSSELNGLVGANQAVETVTIVGTPHITDSEATGTDTVTSKMAHDTYVDYVKGSTGQAIYAITSGELSCPANMMCENMPLYTIASAQYDSGDTFAISQVPNYLSQGTTANQLLAQGNDVCLKQQVVDSDMTHDVTSAQSASPPTTADAGGLACTIPGNATTNPSSLDGGEHRNYLRIIRISQVTVHWLMQSYEVAEGACLSRSTLYCHYLRHCRSNKLCPVRISSFGKIIRSVFCGVTVRKHCTEGNNKYYFHGIRVIPGSSVIHLPRNRKSAVRQEP
jgi:hypothetical protein